MRTAAMLLLVVAMMPSGPVPVLAASRKTCEKIKKADFRCCYKQCDASTYVQALGDLQACLSTQRQRRLDCRADPRPAFKKSDCLPIPADPSPHCKPNVKCIDYCESLVAPVIAKCRRTFERTVRPIRKGNCVPPNFSVAVCKDQARDKFRQCLDGGSTDANCPELLPPDKPPSTGLCVVAPVTTTSIQVSTTTSAPPGTATTTTSSVTTSTTIVQPIPSGCERAVKACIADAMQKCYRQCDDICDGNAEATKLCREGCRNSRCSDLQASCGRQQLRDITCCGTGVQLGQTFTGAPWGCEPTTTSTSLTTSTSTLQSTTTSTSTSTTTTLGP